MGGPSSESVDFYKGVCNKCHREQIRHVPKDTAPPIFSCGALCDGLLVRLSYYVHELKDLK